MTDLLNVKRLRRDTLTRMIESSREGLSRMGRLSYEIMGPVAVQIPPDEEPGCTPLKDLEHEETIEAVRSYDPDYEAVVQWTPSEEVQRRAEQKAEEQGARLTSAPIVPLVRTFDLHAAILGKLQAEGALLPGAVEALK